MKKRSIGIILALLLLFVRAGAAKSAVPEDSEKSNRTWEAGDFTIVFDGIVDESMAGKAQAYEVEFPLPDASLLDLSIFSENFPFAQITQWWWGIVDIFGDGSVQVWDNHKDYPGGSCVRKKLICLSSLRNSWRFYIFPNPDPVLTRTSAASASVLIWARRTH